MTASEHGIRRSLGVLRTPARVPALALAVAVSVAVGAGCETTRSLVEPAGGRSEAYLRVLDAWTRHGVLPDRADTALAVTATYKSSGFREQYVREYADAYFLDDDKVDAITREQRAAADRATEFHVVAYTPDRKLNDFAEPDSVWRIFLKGADGALIAPLAIETVNRRDERIAGFYPYGDAWSRVYNVRFPRAQSADAPALVFTGVKGKLALEW